MNKDTRLITLSSEDAVKLNGSYGSNVFFNIPDLVVDNEYISHLEVALIDAQIPVSWYLINNETNTLNYIYNGSPFSIQLTNGNYNANTLITEMTNRFDDNNLSVIITLSQITGLLLFKFQNAITPIEFVYLGSIGLFRILGFNAGSNVSGVSIVPPNPLNLLGIQKLNIASQNLATISSFSVSMGIASITLLNFSCTIGASITMAPVSLDAISNVKPVSSILNSNLAPSSKLPDAKNSSSIIDSNPDIMS